MKFNVQLGFIVNNNYSNASREKPKNYMTLQSGYSSHNGNKYNSSINIGINFIFGSSKKIKHQMGIDYLRSYGEYEYRVNSIRYDELMIYNSKIDFINFTSGPSFLIDKKLGFIPLLSINYIVHSDIKKTGYISQENSISPYLPDDITYYKDQKVKTNIWSGAISFNPKITYDFNIKRQSFGCYLSYNFCFKLRLPWYMAGITYYPFKKLK